MSFRLRLSYANVAATVACVLALSGTAVAVSTIDGSTIDNRSIAGKKLIRNTATGKEIAEGTLGRVPNADRLDGFSSNVFVKGKNIRVIKTWKRLAATVNPEFVQLTSVPGLGTLEAACSGGGDGFSLRFTSTANGTERFARSFVYEDDANGNASTYGGGLSKGSSAALAGFTNSGTASGFVAEGSIWTETGTQSATYAVHGLTNSTFSGSPSCEVATTITFK
jgi:hypothetical protein